MADNRDPFTILYTAMEAELRAACPTIVSWNSSTDPEPAPVTRVPELQLRPTFTMVMLGASSNQTDVQRTFQILINSGDQRLGQGIFPIEWRLLGCLYRMKYEILDNLTYQGHTFVHTVEITAANVGLSNADQNRGIKGWTALWDVVVHMSFSPADLGA